MSYGQFRDENGESYGSFETFYAPAGYLGGEAPDGEDAGEPKSEPGWYWWSCFPGCMPDGDPHGPFKTEGEAILDAREQ